MSKERLQLVTLALRGLTPRGRFVAEGLAKGPVSIRLLLFEPGVVVGGVFRLGVVGVVAWCRSGSDAWCVKVRAGDGEVTGLEVGSSAAGRRSRTGRGCVIGTGCGASGGT